MDDLTPEAAPEEPTEEAVASAPAVPPSSKVDGKGRERGALEVAVKSVTDSFDNKELVLEDGEFLTPHRIAKEIQTREGRAVSAGAVAAILAKWFDIGYAKLNAKPSAFVGYTEDAFNVGLAALKARAKEAAKTAKAEAKAATATGAVDETEPPEVAPAPAPGTPEDPTPQPQETVPEPEPELEPAAASGPSVGEGV